MPEADTPQPEATQPGAIGRISRLIGAREGELRPALLCALLFFFVLYSYFIMRPIREAAGIEGGVEELPLLFLGTMLAMLLVNPLFALFVASSKRNRFVPATYFFFSSNTVIFAVLFSVMKTEQSLVLGRIFYVWLSVLNLFAMSVFWAVMADVWGRIPGSRLFGFLGVGGTLGALAGSTTTNLWAEDIPRPGLLLIAGIGLAIAAVFSWLVLREAGLGKQMPTASSEEESTKRSKGHGLHPGAEPGKRTIDGIWLLLRSPYLLGISAYVMLFTILSTFMYFLQATIVDAQFETREKRTEFFALLDVVSQSVTLCVQLFLTGRLIRWLGVAWTLAALPLLTAAGLLALGLVIESGNEAALSSSLVLWTFFVFQVLRRGLNYAVAKPSRELLFTVTSQQEKYGSKPIIDTFVYRSGDAIGALSYPILATEAGLIKPVAIAGLGLGAGVLSLWLTPVAVLWLIIGVGLGVGHGRRAKNAS